MKKLNAFDYKMVDARLDRKTRALLLIGRDTYYLVGFNLSKASVMRYREVFKSGNLTVKDTKGIWPVTTIKCISYCELT